MDLKSDIVDILREEAEDAVKDGTPYLQIDAPTFTFLSDTGVAAGFSQASGLSVDQLLDIEIADINQLVSGVRRDGVTLGLHLCRGNHGQYWLNTGGYEPIADKLFNQLDFNRFLLEYDSERAGGFEPLRFVPKGKVAVLGLVSTKIGELESRDTLRRRIDEASKYLPVEQLAISPQCGFSSAALDRCCTWEQQRQKLELVASVAREVWG